MKSDPLYDPCMAPSCSCLCGGDGLCCDPCAASEPPLLDAFESRAIAECATCRAPAVAAARNGGQMYVATEEAFHVVGAQARTIGLPTPPIPSPLSWSYGAPSLHVDATDRVWFAALASSGAFRVLMVSVWTGGDDLGNFVGVDLSHLPLLSLADRAYISEVDGAPVAIVTTRDAAWAFRSLDDGASFGSPEILAPSGGSVVVGAPTLDEKRRLLVPFAWLPASIGPNVHPTAPSATLHYAALADVRGSWSYHAGVGHTPGIATGSRPSLASAAGLLRFSYVDSSGTLTRVESVDGGGSWNGPRAWSDAAEEAVGTAAASSMALRSTASWWDDEGGLRVARLRDDWGEIARATIVQLDAPASSEAALALRANGRALVAWVDEGEVWVGVERGEPMESPCAPDAHCRGV